MDRELKDDDSNLKQQQIKQNKLHVETRLEDSCELTTISITLILYLQYHKYKD